MRTSAWTKLVAVVALALTLAGCARGMSGYKISDETVAFIRPGSTTRSEVVENLGPPLFELQNPHVVAYSWGRVGSVTKAVTQDQGSTAGRMGYGTTPTGIQAPSDDDTSYEARRWICCIALDDGERVTRFGRFEIRGGMSLDQAVREWAASGQSQPSLKK